MNNEIKRQWFYDQPANEIWAYLTKAELIESWLMPNDFKPEVGHEFTFKTNPIPDLGLSGTFHCKVLEIVPLERLVYSWNGGLSKQQPTLKTIVEWTLVAKENGTELQLIHRGFTDLNNTIMNAMFHGWDEHIQKMITHLKT